MKAVIRFLIILGLIIAPSLVLAQSARYTVPFATAFDTFGIVSPGAKLYFYQTGTSTPLNTYSDAGLTTPNANPVVANGAGLFGNIFLLSQNYKVTLTDALGSQIWTADPVSASGGGISVIATIAALQASTTVSTGGASTIYVIGYRSNTDKGGGVFVYVPTDTTSADNGCTIIVNGSGHRFYRQGLGAGLTADQCGAYGDNTHDDGGAFRTAFALSHSVKCAPGETYLISTQITGVLANTAFDCSGAKIALSFSPSSTQFMDIEVSNVTISNIYLIPGSAGNGSGFQVGATATSNNISFSNVIADSSPTPQGLSQIFYLGAGSGIWIDKCNFISTGYGVLQISNKATNNVHITNCLAQDMFAYAVNQNGGSAASINWFIDNFTYLGGHNFPTPETEQGFVAFTNIDGATISNSYAAKAAGDACVHIEGNTTTDIVLTGNQFYDCNGGSGNDGYVYLLCKACSITSSGNAFVSREQSATATFGFSTESGSCSSCTISSIGDTFTDKGSAHTIGGYDLASCNSCTINISGATGENVSYLVFGVTTNQLSVTGSTSNGLNGIYYGTGATSGGGGGVGVTIVGNHINCTVWCIFSTTNTNGTSPPTNWNVSDNYIGGSSTGGVQLQSAVNSWCSGNWYTSGAANHTCANSAGANTVDYKNFLQGTGVIN